MSMPEEYGVGEVDRSILQDNSICAVAVSGGGYAVAQVHLGTGKKTHRDEEYGDLEDT